MNSNYGRSTQSGSLNNFDFDLGIGSNRSKSLNDQKNQTSSYTSSSSSSFSSRPGKPSWSHQPAPSQTVGSLGGPTSMVGDITGKSWASSAPPVSSAGAGIGIINKNPNLFSDLLGSSLGQSSKGNANVPLKSSTPISANKSAYSMGGVADSLPKPSNSVKSTGSSSWGSSQSFGNYSSSSYNNNNNTANRNQGLGGPSMKSSVGNGIGGSMSSNKDPFGSLVDFRTKPAGGMKTEDKPSAKSKPQDDAFGNFQNATKVNSKTALGQDGFGNFPNATTSSSNSFPASNTYQPKNDDFGFPSTSGHVPVNQSTGADAFDVLFSTPSSNAAKGSDASQQFSGAEDWGFESDIGGGGGDMGGTTELEGLPPPPAGVSASSAKNKGMDNYKQGQYPDAIKWLSWAVVLLEKAGDTAGTMEVLSSRASCYKEVGEYKKAVADCTKVLEEDSKNVAVLVQRALLYESMEKYKLGAEDLRTVMNLDPGNRVARSTIHRLTKLAE